MIGAQAAEDGLDGEGKRDRPEGYPVPEETAQITIHADIAGYRHLSLEAAR
jgi:hypothetical protein